MIEEKETIEFEEEKQIPKAKSRKGSFRDIIDGSVLTRQNVVKQLPFILFLTFLGILYIGNRYHAEKVIRKTTEMEQEMRDLRSEYITTAAELMYKSKQSQILRMSNEYNLGLEESFEPPKKIVIEDLDDY
ncbi:MAG: hypothetical protein GVY19_10000 [Bacteroidetes bacterium]|jgi:hypothetical protein|nr:hypothetical protein [Bacteroidota bacterium]